jgi:hypothetical protein
MSNRICSYCHMPEPDWAGNEGQGFQTPEKKWYCCQGCAEGLCTCTTDKIGTGSGAEWRQKKAEEKA